MELFLLNGAGLGWGRPIPKPAPLSFPNETGFNFNKWIWDEFEIFLKPGVGLCTASSRLTLPRLYIKLIFKINLI